jgi:hypothetical protein
MREDAGLQTVRVEAPGQRSLPALFAPELRVALLKHRVTKRRRNSRPSKAEARITEHQLEQGFTGRSHHSVRFEVMLDFAGLETKWKHHVAVKCPDPYPVFYCRMARASIRREGEFGRWGRALELVPLRSATQVITQEAPDASGETSNDA